LITLRIVDVDRRDCEGSRVGDTESLSWGIDDFDVIKCPGYLNFHHWTRLSDASIGALAIPVEWASTIKCVPISIECDVVPTDGEEWTSPRFVSEKDVAIQVYGGAVREREGEAFTSWNREAIYVNSGAFLSRRDIRKGVDGSS